MARTAKPGALEPIIVRPATVDRFDDIEPVINRGCWCQYWRMTASEYGPSTYAVSRDNWDRRREALRAQCAGDPPPGLVAYVGGLPVGWIGFGPRAGMQRMERSRSIPKVDDVPAWSIVCFDVRPGHRRQGIATALLRGLIDYARAHGADALEAYATDHGDTRRNPGVSYTGFTSMFEKAGFQRVVETASHAEHRPRWLMRLDLRERAPTGG